MKDEKRPEDSFRFTAVFQPSSAVSPYSNANAVNPLATCHKIADKAAISSKE